MKKEINLSNKRNLRGSGEKGLTYDYQEKDVKEFIQEFIDEVRILVSLNDLDEFDEKAKEKFGELIK